MGDKPPATYLSDYTTKTLCAPYFSGGKASHPTPLVRTASHDNNAISMSYYSGTLLALILAIAYAIEPNNKLKVFFS